MKPYGWLGLILLTGCATSQQAPVIERAPQPAKKAATPSKTTPAPKPAAGEKDWRPESYLVKKGDTLYGIGLEFGFDYKEIAQWNGIQPPYRIYAGQTLRMKESRTAEGAATTNAIAQPETVVATPIKSEPISGRPLGEPPLKTEPKAIKEPYSEQAMAAPAAQAVDPTAKPIVPAAKTEPPQPVETAKAEAPVERTSSAPEGGNDTVEWGWPAQGKVIAGFNETAGSKGVDIAGTEGQPVTAAGSGKVVYSGSGLRGYGKLVIIKHNKTYLSAYAHNSQILVKEGQEVVKGQKIAEMGNTDTDKVKLHFEIRKLGKPTDPAKFLPEKS